MHGYACQKGREVAGISNAEVSESKNGGFSS